MEVMEDGNLMDKVHILIQRDMEYYKNKQAVLQETICPGIIGGRLDFPRSASFAAMKLVLWWEEEYTAAYRKPSGFLQKTTDTNNESVDESSGGCGGIVKASDPTKFVTLISKSADQLLEHLHVLTQEALDHADLTVLTGTIGAAALLKNCLWYYIQSINDTKGPHIDQLQKGYKKYHEMCEALAERLLDLHCRLMSLYILQDADSLDWENEKAFNESERGSYTIQMWWLYMQGTKEDLWNTVPPKMAQRVFSGMLNESLTILTVRYTQSVPSEARSPLLIVDISNLLLCVAQLLPCICENAEELIGFSINNKSKILRDVHVKCQELFVCFLLRGSSLDDLNKVFKKGLENADIFKSKNVSPCPWIIFALPHVFKNQYQKVLKMSDLNPDTALTLEVLVLMAQPQPNWSLLLKILCMRNCKILKFILNLSLDNFSCEMQKTVMKKEDCGAFLCSGDGSCKNVVTSSSTLDFFHYYDLILSCTDVILTVGNDEDISDILLRSITSKANWAKCFERRQVWNQIRSPWYEAILHLVQPLLPTITDAVINAIQTGATMYQAMSLILACFSQFWDCANPSLPRIAALLQDLLPADVAPLNQSTLLQILISAMYTNLLQKSEEIHKETRFEEPQNSPNKEPDAISHRNSVASLDEAYASVEGIALAVAESLCSIDEDNKHTDQIEEFLNQVKEGLVEADSSNEGSNRVEGATLITEVLVSDLLMTSHGKKSLKTFYHFIKSNSEWLYQKLGVSEENDVFVLPNRVIGPTKPLLYTVFHIGYRPFDQLLTGDWKPNCLNLMQTPMGLSFERVWAQISLRWDFRDINSPGLTAHDIQIINYISSLFKQ